MLTGMYVVLLVHRTKKLFLAMVYCENAIMYSMLQYRVFVLFIIIIHIFFSSFDIYMKNFRNNFVSYN